jgi:hypothetical protein
MLTNSVSQPTSFPLSDPVGLLEQVPADAGLDMLQLCRGQYGKVADIGAADGDLAFFLEQSRFVC